MVSGEPVGPVTTPDRVTANPAVSTADGAVRPTGRADANAAPAWRVPPLSVTAVPPAPSRASESTRRTAYLFTTVPPG